MHCAAIGVHVLTEQIDFPYALLGKHGDLGNHVIEWSADFLAARVWHHAERTVFRATFHDRYVRRRPFRARLGQAIELLDFRKADVYLRLAAAAPCVNQAGQAMQGLRTKHQIHVRCPFEDGLAFLAGHAAADADYHGFVLLLDLFPAPQLAENLVLRVLADRTSVDQDHIGITLIQGKFQSMTGLEHVGHLGRVVLVHLATVGFYVELAGHGTCEISMNATVYAG